MRLLEELTYDGTGLGDANGRPNEAMQILCGLAEMLAVEHDVALKTQEVWQFELLRGHLRDCLDYASTLGGDCADIACVTNMTQKIQVPPKWIVLAYRWAERAPKRPHDDPLLESLLPSIIAFVLKGSERTDPSEREWKGVSLAALLIAFHLGRLSQRGQLLESLAKHEPAEPFELASRDYGDEEEDEQNDRR
jgi:hypothetical protein